MNRQLNRLAIVALLLLAALIGGTTYWQAWAAADLQNRFVHRLGNLTLSGYNSDLATASFEKKQKLAKKSNSFLIFRLRKSDFKAVVGQAGS